MDMHDALSALDRAREINARMEAKRAEMIGQINQAVALVLVLCTVAVSFVLFGAPEMERQARIHQEISHVAGR